MTLWCVKGGSYGEREKRMLDRSLIGIGWNRFSDLSQVQDKKQLEQLYNEKYPEADKYRAGNHVGQLHAFLHKMKIDDLVVSPLKTQSLIAIGRVSSEYKYRPDLGDDMKHIRQVEWIKEDIPRTEFEQDLLYSFGAFMTICRITRNNAEERVKAFLQGKKLTIQEEFESEESSNKDIEGIAQDQIREYINRNFKGHELTKLIEAVLKTQGLFTKMMDPGPDGGVDILAGGGSMGFDEPKICVQVKSSDNPVDVNILRELAGTMRSFKATKGLLVSWGGFKRTVVNESRNDFFNIRFWESKDIINAIQDNFDKLPDSIQAELPLKRIWTLTNEDEE